MLIPVIIKVDDASAQHVFQHLNSAEVQSKTKCFLEIIPKIGGESRISIGHNG